MSLGTRPPAEVIDGELIVKRIDLTEVFSHVGRSARLSGGRCTETKVHTTSQPLSLFRPKVDGHTANSTCSVPPYGPNRPNEPLEGSVFLGPWAPDPGDPLVLRPTLCEKWGGGSSLAFDPMDD